MGTSYAGRNSPSEAVDGVGYFVMTIYHQTIEAYAAAISAMDPDAFAACFAADCELNDPAGSPTVRGQEGAKAFLRGFLPILSKVQFQPGTVRTGGSRAAFTWTIQAEGKTGQLGTADGIDVVEFDEAGKIVRTHAFWNPGQLVAALTA